MALNLASPGILIREVDLTIGRIDGSTGKVGGIVGSFEKGPVGEPTVITGENDLFDQFGQPYDTDKQYETWMVASSYLSYGGSLNVIRADDDGLKNGFVGATGITTVKIRSTEHYQELGYQENTLDTVTVAARNPGSWSNGIRIAIIDGLADQILTLSDTSGINVGTGITQSIPAGTIDANGTTLTGHFKGIVTGVGTTSGLSTDKQIAVKVVGVVTTVDDIQVESAADYNSIYKFAGSSGGEIVNFPNTGAGTTSANIVRAFGGTTPTQHNQGVTITSFFLDKSGTLDQAGNAPLLAGATEIGINTTGLSDILSNKSFIGIGTELIDATGASIGLGKITGLSRGSQGTTALEHAEGSVVKILTRNQNIGDVTAQINNQVTKVGITTNVDISAKVNAGGFLRITNEVISVSQFFNGQSTQTTSSLAEDWFDNQKFDIATASVGGEKKVIESNWNAIAERPGTSDYASKRGGRFDEVHVLVIDAKGTVSGNAGTILEKHLNLSKAKDATFSVGSPSYWRKYLYTNSTNIFGLSGNLIGVTTTGFTGDNFTPFADGSWDQNAEGVVFNASGAQNLVFSNGANYGGVEVITATGALNAKLGGLVAGYKVFENDGVNNVDFLLMGGGHLGKNQTRQLASTLIAVAEERKDAVAFISPSRDQVVADTTDQTAAIVLDDQKITDNLVDFYDPVPSTTFGVFDSGYKYMYDRFNEVFRYIPLNGDIAGLCARNDINDFPWFSPAGTDRGAILNAVKLPYNPTRLQRDKLYSSRINPVVNSPGAGIILFGDKTGFAKASAFDRINVRRLFIFLEQGIAAAAKDQLFEFNDEITRANFVNIVEPFLRDVQSKRGIQDYVVICDETNNTAAVIDNNEFIADIFIKPARSINFIGLTFVATRTGISFEEVIGSV